MADQEPSNDEKVRSETVFQRINRMSVMNKKGHFNSDKNYRQELKPPGGNLYPKMVRTSVMAPKAANKHNKNKDPRKSVAFDIEENEEENQEKKEENKVESGVNFNSGLNLQNNKSLINLESDDSSTFSHLDNFDEPRVRAMTKNVFLRKKTLASEVLILNAEKEEEQANMEKRASRNKSQRSDSAADQNDVPKVEIAISESGKRQMGPVDSGITSSEEYSHLISQNKKRCCGLIFNFFHRINQYLKDIYTAYNNSFTRVLIASDKTREVDLSKIKMSRIILPTSLFRQNWDILILTLIFYDLVLIPLVIAFDVEQRIEITVMEFLILGLFMIDIAFNFRTGYLNSRGVLELNPTRIYYRYRRKYLLVDLISSLPVLLIFQFFYYSNILSPNAQNDYSNLVYLYRLTRLSRLFRILARFNENTKYNPALVRITKSVLLLIFLWHWIACFYWFIAERREFQENSWTPSPRYINESLFQQYSYAFLWAVTVTVGIGLEIHPKASSEVIFTTVVIIIGVVIYGILLGSTSSAFLALDDQDAELRKQLESLNNFMRKKKVNIDLQKRIQENLKYLWSSQQTLNVSNQWFLEGVHPLLKLELVIQLNKKYIDKIPMFKGIGFSETVFLLNLLESRIFLPEELVVVAGSLEQNLYFIQSGILEVVNKQADTRVRLYDGDFFGEQSLFVRKPKTADIKCLIYSELLILSRFGLIKLIHKFPDFAIKLFHYLKERSKNSTARGQSKWLVVSNLYNIARFIKMKSKMLNISDILTSSADSSQGIAEMNNSKKNSGAETNPEVQGNQGETGEERANEKLKKKNQNLKSLTSFYTMTQHLSELVQQTDDKFLKSNFIPSGAGAGAHH